MFIFLIMPMRGEATYEEYRKYRLALLHAYVQTARLQAHQATTFVGIAFDNPHKDYKGSSEDLFVLRKDHWTEAELAELEQNQKEFDFWKPGRFEQSRHRQDEFPSTSQAVAIQRVSPYNARSQKGTPDNAGRKVNKQRKKARQASQRANRKRK
ncbi:MAG: hypothetical protein EOO81_11975 [Oxalobacteraceae bacterium]|nr:MAG: hypothetical protein EOO81_11975 [Oxalobacteraceae bacterium]